LYDLPADGRPACRQAGNKKGRRHGLFLNFTGPLVFRQPDGKIASWVVIRGTSRSYLPSPFVSVAGTTMICPYTHGYSLQM